MKFTTAALSLLSVVSSNYASASAESCDTVTRPYCVGDEIAVFGHRSPDTDAILSAIIYAWELEHPTHPTHTEPLCSKAYINTNEPNRETQFVLDYFNVQVPPILDSITEEENTKLFATVDTNNIDEMPDGTTSEMISNNLHSIIDHHKLTGSFVTNKPINIDIRNLGSAGSVLYQRSIEAGRPIPGKSSITDPCDTSTNINIAGLMMATILSDTLNLQSPTTTQLDIDAVEYLAPLAGINDVDNFFHQMMDAKSDLNGISAMEIINMDSKIYEFIDYHDEKFNMRISVFESSNIHQLFENDFPTEISNACEIQLALDQEKIGQSIMRSLLFFAIDIVEQKATYIPCASRSEYDRQLVLQGEYPDMIGTPTELSWMDMIELDGVISRKLQLIPGLTVSSDLISFGWGDDNGEEAEAEAEAATNNNSGASSPPHHIRGRRRL